MRGRTESMKLQAEYTTVLTTHHTKAVKFNTNSKILSSTSGHLWLTMRTLKFQLSNRPHRKISTMSYSVAFTPRSYNVIEEPNILQWYCCSQKSSDCNSFGLLDYIYYTTSTIKTKSWISRFEYNILNSTKYWLQQFWLQQYYCNIITISVKQKHHLHLHLNILVLEQYCGFPFLCCVSQGRRRQRSAQEVRAQGCCSR